MAIVVAVLPWHALSTDGGQWQAIDGAGHKVGFQQLSIVATCTSKTQSLQHTFACSSLPCHLLE